MGSGSRILIFRSSVMPGESPDRPAPRARGAEGAQVCMDKGWYDKLAVAVRGLVEATWDGGNRDAGADLALRLARDLTGSQAGYLCWSHNGRSLPVCLASTGDGLGLEEREGHTVLPDTHPLWRAMQTGDGPLVNSQTPSGLADLPLGLAGRPWMSLPLKTGDELRGQLTLAGAPDGYGECELSAVAALAGASLVLFHRVPDAETERFMSYPQLRNIFEHAPVGICFGDSQGRFMRVNQRFADMLGYSPKELTGMKFQDVTHPDDLAKQQRERRLLWDGSQPEYRIEKRYLCRDGGELWCSLTVSALTDEQGEPTAILGICEDIHAAKAAEQALRHSEERFRTLVQNLPGTVYRCELDFPYYTSYLSEGIEALTGYRAQDINSGQAPPLGALIHPDDRLEVQRLVSQGVAGRRPFEMEYRLRRQDGTYLWVHELGRAIYDHQGRPQWVDGVILDVTSRRELENQLQQAHKLRSLADVTGGVAHDFNNMLAGVLGYAELLRDQLPPGNESVKWLDKLENSAQRAADLTRQMLAYTGRWLHRPEMVNLSGHLERMSPMLSGAAGTKAALKLNLTSGLPTLLVDPAQLTQVALALVTNAAEALGDGGGEITLTTGLTNMDGDRLTKSYLYEDQQPGLYLYLEVSDDGEGFDHAQRNRLFDPFYTTKFTGRGMGLAVVLGIVRQHRGAIEVQGDPGRGACFRVLWPLGGGRPEPANGRTLSSPTQDAQITVMVVDDDASVLESTALWLENRGVTVWRAGGGRQAVEVFQQSGDSVDVVLLDLTMPDMDGPEVVAALKAVRPGVPVILASGYSESDLAARARELGVDDFLPKPFDFKRMLETIVRVTRAG